MPWTWARAMPSGCSSSAGRAAESRSGVERRGVFVQRTAASRSAAGSGGFGVQAERHLRARRCGGRGTQAVGRGVAAAGSPGARMTAARRDPMRASRMRAYRRRASAAGVPAAGMPAADAPEAGACHEAREASASGEMDAFRGVRGACAASAPAERRVPRHGLWRDGGRAAGLRQRLADRGETKGALPLSRKRTSLGGWTLTSTAAGSMSRNST